MAFYEIRDPIHGFIRIDDLERRLIDSKPFQRLRNIRQLGTTFLVYPGANHTRFEHSLGTMHVATELFDLLLLKFSGEFSGKLRWNSRKKERYKCLLRIAALLHDVGHAPFSHSSEEVMPDSFDHERYTELIIKQSEIATVLKSGGFNDEQIQDIADIATGLSPKPDLIFLSELLTGEIGADRIDYLLRDSHHTGVYYGRFDHYRVLHTMLPNFVEPPEGGRERPHLAIEEGGIHAVEGLLLARYFMFLQVYFQHTRRILDIHLNEFLGDILPGGKYPTIAGDFLEWDNKRVLTTLANGSYPEHEARLLRRQHFKVVDQTLDHPDRADLTAFAWLWSDIGSKLDSDWVRLDNKASTNTYNYSAEPTIRIKRSVGPDAGKFVPLVGEEGASTILKNIQRVNKQRIYANRNNFPQVKEFVNEFWPKLPKGGR